MDFLPAMLSRIGSSATNWLIIFGIVTALELLAPRERHSAATRLQGLVFWAVWIPIATLVLAGFAAVWKWLGVAPLFSLPAAFGWAGAAAMVLTMLAGAFVSDFFFYWCHRAQHAWLWRFHAVHHSVRDLNALTSYHHPSAIVVETAMIAAPVSLLFGESAAASGAMVVLLWVQVVFLHSPTRLHLGPLRMLFADNRFHRIHHSMEPRHFDKNFGAFTTLWDRLFGTAWYPAPGEWPAVGVAGVEPPASLRQWLLMPFREASTAAPPPAAAAAVERDEPPAPATAPAAASS